MQFSSVVTFLTLAMSAAAAPAPAPAEAEVVARTTVTECKAAGYTPYCCKPSTSEYGKLIAGLLGADVTAMVDCTTVAVGDTCSATVKCCNGNTYQVGCYFPASFPPYARYLPYLASYRSKIVLLTFVPFSASYRTAKA